MVLDLRPSANLIDKDIALAETLPARFYRDESYIEMARESIFLQSWQFITDAGQISVPGKVVPYSILPGFIDEPIVISRDNDDKLHCMSNVCTHRGNLLVESECHTTQGLRCRYHGRRFSVSGEMISTPGFEKAPCFPRENGKDNLSSVPFASWDQFLFAGVTPAFSFEELIAPMKERLSWLPLKDFVYDPTRSTDYFTDANWALYCENYLEGFHIPYVHPALAKTLDCKDYDTIIYPYSVLQVGIANNPSDAFDIIPKDSPDYGKNIGAYYWWLFPNMMFNFYPWGLSLNIIVPLSKDRTRVSYITYMYDESKLDHGAGANVDQTEREDQSIIEQVQRGIRSHFYERGRYSPDWEKGPHHFHQLLTQFLSSTPA